MSTIFLRVSCLLLLTGLLVGSSAQSLSGTDGNSNSLSVGYFQLPTYVFNVFPVTNVSAFVLFEEERVSRLDYGQLRHASITFQEYSDFIIQFRKIPTDVVKNEYTDYGFMESELSANKEVILIIRRNNRNHDLPQHHLIVFNKDNINDDTSKVYIYNAIKNTVSSNQGLYFYGLYQRRNFDGSMSESMTQLAVNLQMNEGIDINIQPMTAIDIKVFYTSINTVLEFKNTEYVLKYDGFMIKNSGVRKYMICYGNYKEVNDDNDVTRPRLTVLNDDRRSGSGYKQSYMAIITIMTIIIIVLHF